MSKTTAVLDDSSLYTDEVKFAKQLVHPDKAVRDDTLRNLQLHLRSVTSFNDFSMLKLWKALYYCLWLADKVPIQQELIGSIVAITTLFATTDVSMLYLQQFYRILFREWASLDQYRVEKFYSLIRAMLNKMLSMIVHSHYSSDLVESLLNLLYTEALVKSPNGIRYHIADIYIEELYKVTGGDVKTTAFMALLRPFIQVITNAAEQGLYMDRIYKQVFTKYLTEYSSESYNKRKDSSSDPRDGAVADATVSADEPVVPPRVFPHMQCKQLQKVVFDLASSDGTASNCRKRLYSLHKQLSAVTGCDFVEESYDIQALEALDDHINASKKVDNAASLSAATPRKTKKSKRVAVSGDDRIAEVDATKTIDNKTTKIAVALHDETITFSSSSSSTTQRSKQQSKRALEVVEQGVASKKALQLPAKTIPGEAAPTTTMPSKDIPEQLLFIASKAFGGRKDGYKFQKVSASVITFVYHHLCMTTIIAFV